MVGKAFTWKAVTDLPLTAELGGTFQRGITSGKKENLYKLVRAKSHGTVKTFLQPFKISTLFLATKL